MTEKQRQIAKAVTLTIILILAWCVVFEACPAGNYPTISQWWNEGQAQMTEGCHDDPVGITRFWGDDLLSNFISNTTRWIAKQLISLWNKLATSWIGPLLLGLVVALAGALLYDLLKALVKTLLAKSA